MQEIFWYFLKFAQGPVFLPISPSAIWFGSCRNFLFIQQSLLKPYLSRFELRLLVNVSLAMVPEC